MFRIYALTVLCCFCSTLSVFSQTISSVKDGNWDDPTVWSGCSGCIPSSVNSAQINILDTHDVTIRTAVTISQLTVQSGGTLTMNASGAISSVTTGIIFQNNTTYFHGLNGKAVPTATWQAGSTCKITGWTTLQSGADFTSFTNSLVGQSFHHFWWESTGQTAANVLLAGSLTTVNGDLTISSTGSSTNPNTTKRVVLGFNASSGTGTTTVGGNLVVSGNSQFAVNVSNGTGTYTLNVGQNVSFSSTNPAVANSAVGGTFIINSASGTATLNIGGSLTLNSGALNISSSNVGGASATGNINIGGDLILNGGNVNKLATAGTANINFTGNGLHTYTLGTTTFASHSINYSVNAGSTLDLGTSALGPVTRAGNFDNYGTIRVGSTASDFGEGAIGGNIRPATRTFHPGSAVIYTGTAPQFMGSDQPAATGVTTTIANANGVTLVGEATIGGDLILQSGNVNLDANKLTLNGSLTANTNFLGITPSSSLEIGGTGNFGVIPFTGGNDLMDLTLNRTSSTTTLGDDLTVQGVYNQLEGVLELNGHTLTLLGPFYDDGNFSSNSATSSLIILNEGDMPTSVAFSGPLNTLTLDRPFSELLTSSTFVVTNLNLLGGLVSNTNGLQIASGGTITRNLGSMAVSPGGTGAYNLVYVNDEEAIDAGVEFHNNATRINDVTIAGGMDVTMISNRTINGTLTLENGGLNAGTTGLTLKGDLVGNSTGSFLSSTVIFGGTSTISGTSIPALGAVTLQNGATLNMPAELSIGGALTISATGIFNHNNGNVTLTGGTGTQLVNTNNAIFYNLTVDKSVNTNVQLNSALRLTNLLSILSTNSKLVSGGFLHLLSTSDDATGNASIGPLLNGTEVTGDVIVDRFMSSEGRIYRYFSSPTTNATIAQVRDDFPVTGNFPGSSICSGCSKTASMFYYDYAISDYVAYPVTGITDPLEPGRGYSAFVRQNVLPGPVILDVTGPINQGPVSLPVGFNTNLPDDSWSLVGNPYPSSIDWDNEAGWTKTNVGTVAVRDNGTGGGGTFLYWNGATGGLTDGEIATGQGFWVRATGAAPALALNEQAKTPSTGAYYRTGEASVLTVKLAKGNIWDRAYVQLDDKAVKGLDALDATKLLNENFDFSTRFSDGVSRMAINAVDQIACGTELILDLQFTKSPNGTFVLTPAGNYTMEFTLAGSKFAQYKITLVDRFTGQQQAVSDNASLSFTMTTAAASYAADRFRLLFEGKTQPNLALRTDGTTAICSDGEASLVIEGSETDFEYYLLGDNSAMLSSSRAGNGGALTLSIPAASLTEGMNEIAIGVKGFCVDGTLASTWKVVREVATAPAVAYGKHCQPGSVQLSASGAGASGDYRWYETLDATSTVGTGPTFVTPSLPKSKTYYASIVTSAGCEGIRQPVLAEVVLYDEVVITAADGDVLSSNFATGNQWYFNQQPIEGATGKTFKAEKSGLYEVAVTVGGCATTDNMEYMVTGAIDEIVASVSGYPNPAWKEINVSLKGSVREIQSVDITSVTGQAVGQVMLQGSDKEKSGSMNVEQLMQGIYLMKIQLPAKTMVFKFVKQ